MLSNMTLNQQVHLSTFTVCSVPGAVLGIRDTQWPWSPGALSCRVAQAIKRKKRQYQMMKKYYEENDMNVIERDQSAWGESDRRMPGEDFRKREPQGSTCCPMGADMHVLGNSTKRDTQTDCFLQVRKGAWKEMRSRK